MIRDNLSLTHRALIELLSGTVDVDTIGKLGEGDWATMAQFAEAQNLSGLLFNDIKQKGIEESIPAATLQKLRERYFAQAGLGALIYGQLKPLLNSLGAHEIPVIVLKGAHLAQHVYKNPAVRVMGDIDLLVRHEDLKAAESVLAELGYHAKAKVWIDSPDPTWKHLPRMFIADALPLEVHWTICHPEDEFAITPDELWDRAIEIEYAGAPAQCLSPEDLLLHLCVHSVYQHAFDSGLRDLCDVDQTVRRYADELNWEILAARADKWKARNSVWIALNAASLFLNTPLPGTFLETIKPERVDDKLISWLYGRLLKNTEGFSTERFAGLMNERGIKAKIISVLNAIFPSRREMSGMYPVPASSIRIFFYYPIRWVDLIRRYSPVLWRMALGDDRPKILGENQAMQSRLQSWLRED